jgi:hypothetical protein
LYSHLGVSDLFSLTITISVKSRRFPVHIDRNKTALQIIAKTPGRLGAKAGKYKVSWYECPAKKFEAGSYQFLSEAIRAAKFRQVQLQGKNNGVVIEDPKTKDIGRLTIDIAAAA